MPAVNWNQPSTGAVSDLAPALTVKNEQNGALVAGSKGVAVYAESIEDEAVVAQADKNLAGRFASDQSVGALGFAPKATGLYGVNLNGDNAAVVGVNGTDPALPGANKEGVGVLGMTLRNEATGTVGFAFGKRSVGVHGEAVESGIGVRGLGSSGGVQGFSSGNIGVAGVTGSEHSAGVYGFGPGQSAGIRAEAIAGPGLEAHSIAGTGVQALSEQAHGVVSEAKAENASGVIGKNDHQMGVGVDGFSQNGTAVRAESSHGTAIYAQSWDGSVIDASKYSQSAPAIDTSSLSSTAVRALSGISHGIEAVGNTGVFGFSWSPPTNSDEKDGVGVFGGSLVGKGISGSTLSGIGVHGLGVPQFGAWAGYFQGNVHVTGMFSKSASCFSIDHPLDPKRKVLNHASVEAPEYKTFYDGVVTLNARGQGRVRLPRWFTVLNRDLRYQLTSIGAPVPNLHVSQEVKNNMFVIAGGSRGQKVCWQVTGVRRDTWAQANPLKVEQAKREARQNIGTSTVAELQRSAEKYKKRVVALRKEASKRERLMKARPPKPRTAPSPVVPGVSNKTLGKIADRATESFKDLIRSDQ